MDKPKKGYVPVMLTPFEEQTGAVDYEALTRLTELYLRAGVAGLFANCLSSEMYKLSEEERLQTVKQVLHVASGEVAVVATGTFHGSLQQQADFMKRMHDTGVQAVIIITSVLAAQYEPDTILDDRIFQLLELTGDIKLGLYECPVPYKRIISATQLKSLYPLTGSYT